MIKGKQLAIVVECCDERVFVGWDIMRKANIITCPSCDKPLLVREGKMVDWYHVGNRVFSNG